MSDKTMEDIKSGKGLSPLSSNNNSSSQFGVTREQKVEKGITYETFSYNSDRNNSDSKGND